MKLLVRWLVNAAALWAAASLVPGIVVTGGLGALLVAALVVGLLNALVKPVLVVLTLPLTVLSLGLFLLVLNGFLLWLAGALAPGLHLEGFLAAVLGALVMSVVGMVLHSILGGDEG